jgi:hypothetical protein
MFNFARRNYASNCWKNCYVKQKAYYINSECWHDAKKNYSNVSLKQKALKLSQILPKIVKVEGWYFYLYQN